MIHLVEDMGTWEAEVLPPAPIQAERPCTNNRMLLHCGGQVIERSHYDKLVGRQIAAVFWEDIDGRPLPVLLLTGLDREAPLLPVSVLVLLGTPPRLQATLRRKSWSVQTGHS